ncbi:MAG: hypothetical protein R2940_15345 [Syntrophotaleaceae bacterium]
MQQERKKPGFRPLLTIFALFLAALLALEIPLHLHGYFGWDEWFGFNAAIGLVSCLLLVLAARCLVRPLLRRDEDYYDR